MTDLTPDHPAVEAAARIAYERAWFAFGPPWNEVDDLERDEWRADEAHSLSAAIPHLTADDLRNTPPGWQLMAAGYKAALAQIDALADFYEEGGDTSMAENMRDVRRRMARRQPYLEGDA